MNILDPYFNLRILISMFHFNKTLNTVFKINQTLNYLTMLTVDPIFINLVKLNYYLGF
jgi:hypothetical protein